MASISVGCALCTVDVYHVLSDDLREDGQHKLCHAPRVDTGRVLATLRVGRYSQYLNTGWLIRDF